MVVFCCCFGAKKRCQVIASQSLTVWWMWWEPDLERSLPSWTYWWRLIYDYLFLGFPKIHKISLDLPTLPKTLFYHFCHFLFEQTNKPTTQPNQTNQPTNQPTKQTHLPICHEVSRSSGLMEQASSVLRSLTEAEARRQASVAPWGLRVEKNSTTISDIWCTWYVYIYINDII